MKKWRADGKNDKEMERKRSVNDDDFFGNDITASSEKRRMTITESLAGPGEF